MKNVLISGSTGMTGKLVLDYCLEHEEIEKVTSIVRRSSGIKNSKLNEIIHSDFYDYSNIADQLKNQDICFFCLGVYSGSVSKEEFREITVDYTLSLAESFRLYNENSIFCYLSGKGADMTEKSKIMFARDKGAAENRLIKLNFNQTYLFRPGYIYPIEPRAEPNLMYRLSRLLYKPLISKMGKNASVPSDMLAKVMVDIGIKGGEKVIYENIDIIEHFTLMSSR